ncbi:hypothetical protein [Legionella bononiensis]|uniref:Ankyrin repeat-containing protein n=1 Tax=Legionella bononiensis TaxID=2793102 RepID=A0ABS1W6R3_9GAMM|nr:hypothetical protein [Legionella bononiensis]MBL7478454.1 hypothetical protein [Legionella bononiensis]MBL7525051.1 hypothetical protein [Legionella bononiensis]MBL7561347.1 hypothetical protein [Legionella bononiensis]
MNTPNDKEIPLGYDDVIGMDQYHLIPMINAYLQHQGKIQLKADNNGLCNGLSSVYCKYVIEGKQDEFIKIIQAIIKKAGAIALIKKGEIAEGTQQFNESGEISDSQINKFIGEAIFALLPEEFDKRYAQDDSVSLLGVSIPVKDADGKLTGALISKPMQKVYNLGLIAKTEEWSKIFEQMKANETSWTISSLKHTIAISVIDGQFHVYDPNDRKIMICDNGEELANLLASDSFGPDRNKQPLTQMPLTINVMAHPDKQISYGFPDKAELVEGLMEEDPAFLTRMIDVNVSNFDQLSVAAMQNDVRMIEVLFDLGVTGSDMALARAAKHNRLDAIEVLLRPEYKDRMVGLEFGFVTSTYDKACVNAIEEGRIEALERLLKDEDIGKRFDEYIQNPYVQKRYLQLAAKSNNPECIEKVISLIEKNNPGIDIPGLITDAKAIPKAIATGNRSCIELLKEKAGLETTVQKTAPEANTGIVLRDKSSMTFIESLIPFTQFLKTMFTSALNAFTKLISISSTPDGSTIMDTEQKGAQKRIKDSVFGMRDSENTEQLQEKDASDNSNSIH